MIMKDEYGIVLDFLQHGRAGQGKNEPLSQIIGTTNFNLLEIVPVEDEEEQQIVLKAVSYFEEGMTPFDSFHAATAETRGLPILPSDRTYGDVDPERRPLEPASDE